MSTCTVQRRAPRSTEHWWDLHCDPPRTMPNSTAVLTPSPVRGLQAAANYARLIGYDLVIPAEELTAMLEADGFDTA